MGGGFMKIIAQNKKARFDYFIEDVYEAGIALMGTEVKSIRAGKVSIKEAYVKVNQNEVFIVGMNISPYEYGNIYNKDPLRTRKLLLHRNEIRKIQQALDQNGYALVPLSVKLSGRGFVKIDIATAKGKKLHDKRDTIAKRDAERNMKIKMREYNRQ